MLLVYMISLQTPL